ncbi:hypothetical protein D3C76_819340 [compost metagenome]
MNIRTTFASVCTEDSNPSGIVPGGMRNFTLNLSPTANSEENSLTAINSPVDEISTAFPFIPVFLVRPSGMILTSKSATYLRLSILILLRYSASKSVESLSGSRMPLRSATLRICSGSGTYDRVRRSGRVTVSFSSVFFLFFFVNTIKSPIL